MTPDQLLQRLNAAIAAGVVNATIAPGVGTLLARLGETALPISGGSAQLIPGGATLVSTGTWRAVSWILTLTALAEPDRFSLSLEPAPGALPWLLRTSFPALPPSWLSDPDGVGMAVTDSVLASLSIADPYITADDSVAGAPARWRGTLLLAVGPLAPYVAYFGADGLAGTGELDFTTLTDPRLSFRAAAPRAPQVIAGTPVPFESSGVVLNSHERNLAWPEPHFISSAAVFGVVPLPLPDSPEILLSAPLLRGDAVWPISASLSRPLTIRDSAGLLSGLFPDVATPNFTLPAGIVPLDAFGFSALEFGLIPPEELVGVPTVAHTSVTLRSTSAWDTPLAFVAIEEVGAQWMVVWGDPLLVDGRLFGTLRFGAKPPRGAGQIAPVLDANADPVFLDVAITLPELLFSAETRGDIALPFANAFAAYFTAPKPNVPAALSVTAIRILASIPGQTYSGWLQVTGNWPLEVGNIRFNLDSILFQMTVSPNSVTGAVTGTVGVEAAGSSKFQLAASANYTGNGVWLFEGGLFEGAIDLKALLWGLLGSEPPSWAPTLELTELWVTYSTDTANGAPYSARATVVGRWTATDALSIPISLTARAQVERKAKLSLHDQVMAAALPHTADVDTITSGAVSGTLELNRLVITVGLVFNGTEKTYLFKLQYGTAALEATTAWTGAPNERRQILNVSLVNVRLGDILRFLAALANPNLNVRLEAPWSFLDAIDLSRFVLVLDPQKQTVEFRIRFNTSLPFLTIDEVGLIYDRSKGNASVRLRVYGDLLGKDYRQRPLEWDALEDAPPPVPGSGSQLIDLRYLGMGQHVRLTNLHDPDSMEQVLETMRADMRPVTDGSKNPLTGPVAFDASSRWMIAADVTVMSTVSVKLVMRDPDLYGVLIALAGPESASLAGLSFELLYKKVSSDVGVFHARFQVPDAFRQFFIGPVSVTLGVVTVDVFTNGNFLIDLGFPHNRDFAASFALEAGPFIGRGGLYFGLLDGATSKRVPRPTNGHFAPVLELGVGLAVGVGRTFEKGPLKAGLYVTLEVIFEGVLGWFHPDNAGDGTSLYYWCRGTAGIAGKLYGSVDFKIIRVDVSVEAYALVTLTLTAHEPALVELNVGVKVHASVTVVFVSISFSFDLTLDASFTIGERSRAAWILADSGSDAARIGGRGSGSIPGRLTPQISARRRRSLHLLSPALRSQSRLRRGRVLRATGQDVCAGYSLVWNENLQVFPSGVQKPVRLTMLPGYTIADVPVDWTGGSAPPNTTPDYRIAFTIVLETGVPVEPETIRATHALSAQLSAAADSPDELSFPTLIEAMTRWSIAALGIDPLTGTVSAGDLEELAAELDCPQTSAQGFTRAKLEGFFGTNLRFTLTGLPNTSRGPATLIGVAAFPQLPVLRWQWSEPLGPQQERDFSLYGQIDATYERDLTDYFAELAAGSHAAAPTGTTAAAELDPTAESASSYLFRDYFLMIAKAAIQSSLALAREFPCDFDGTQSLADLARQFPTVTVSYVVHQGDTVEQVAALYVATANELTWLDPTLPDRLRVATPGTAIDVKLGATPQAIAAANPLWPLVAGGQVDLRTVQAQVRVVQGITETLAAVAARLGTTVDHWLAVPDVLDTPRLLRVGAVLPQVQRAFANPAALSLNAIASVFFVRLPMAAEVPLADWYARAIAKLNPTAIDATGRITGPVVVPARYGQSEPTVAWTPLPGDTLSWVGAYFSLQQNGRAMPAYATYLTAVQALNPVPGATVQLPAGLATVLGDETLARLAQRLLYDLTNTADAAAFRTFVSGADVLAPLAVVPVPEAHATTVAGETLTTFAERIDLPLEELGTLAAASGGFLQVVAQKRPVATAVPALTVTQLVARVLEGAPVATIAGQVSRFLMHGLRVPGPVWNEAQQAWRATGPQTSLVDLVGTQISSPAPDLQLDPATVRLNLRVDAPQPVSWLTFAASATVGPGDDAAQFAAMNPAIMGRARAGMVALTAEADSLSFAITEHELRDGYPAVGLKPDVLSAPAALSPVRMLKVRYPLEQVIRWQTTQAITLPGAGDALSGTLSLWPFGSTLLALAAKSPAAEYELIRVDAAADPTALIAVDRSAWATQIRIRINRIPGRADLCEVRGADSAGRETLLLLWQALATQPAALSILYELSAGAGLPPGLTSTALDPAATYIVKTNLSTQTQNSRINTPQAAVPVYSASLAQAAEFLQLVWECSVTGRGGFWLRYAAVDGSAIPDAIFDQDGNAFLTLLALPVMPVRLLFPYTNCAVVGPGMDPGASVLFARAADGSEVTRTASMAPGEIGFTFGLHRAVGGATTDPQARLRQLYSLTGYELIDSPAFKASQVGLPAGPQTQPDNEDHWRLDRVVPIVRFAKSKLSLPAPFPPVTANAYAGVGGWAKIQLSFNDVSGNRSSQASDPGGALELNVYYTDPLIGVSSWPATASWYCVESVASPRLGALLRASLAFQTTGYLPGAMQDASSVGAAATEQSRRFAQIAYQIGAADISASVLTSLQQGKNAAPLPLDDPGRLLLTGLRAYVNAAYVWLGAAAGLQSVYVDPGVSPTLTALLLRTGVDADALAAANAKSAVADLIGAAAVTLPQFAVAQVDRSVRDICPQGIDPVTVMVRPENLDLPLQVRVELVTAPQSVAVTVAQSLSDIAKVARCSPAGIAAANRATPGLLQPGFIFTCEGLQVKVDVEAPRSETTLDLVAQTFAGLGLPFDAIMVAAANQDVPGMFRTGTVTSNRYTTVAGDSLNSNHSAYSGGALGLLNTDTVNLFPAGTPLLVATWLDSSTALSLSALANIHAVTPGDVLRANLSRAPTDKMAVPGRGSFAPATTLLPYAIRPGDTLAGLAGLITPGVGQDPVMALACVNAALPIIMPGVSVTVDGRSVQTIANDTLTALCARFSPPVQLQQLVPVVGALNPFLLTGAVMVVTPIRVSGSQTVALRALAAPFGVDPAALAAANIATAGLVAAGVTLHSKSGHELTVVTAADDSIASILRRLALAGVEVTTADFASVNMDIPFLRSGAVALLPPPQVSVVLPIAPTGAWLFPGPVFALQAWIEIRRRFTLVDPQLRGTEDNPTAAVVDRSNLPVARTPSQSAGNALSLQAFATRLQAAIPGLRAAAGRGAAPGTSDVWAVDFGTGGLSSVQISPTISLPHVTAKQPRCYALRPLSAALVSRAGVAISRFDPADGKLHPDGTRDYQGIDLEPWAQTFLSDVDLFCSAPYATGAKRANALQLTRFLQGKEKLAGAISAGLDIVTESSGTVPDLARAQAVETLRQQLLGSLLTGYGVDAIAQFDGTIVSPWTTEYARLSGSATIAQDPVLGDLTVGSAKISLQSGTSYLSLIFETAQPERLRFAAPTLSYTINELEFDIHPVESYESSRWLSFVLPLRTAPGLSIDFGHPQIPLPLRGYPSMPVLVAHQARGADRPQTIQEATLWSYVFTYEHQSAAQETVGFALDLNVTGEGVGDAVADDDLFARLAQYISVREAIWTLFAALPDVGDVGIPPPLVEGIATYTKLVNDVVERWALHWDNSGAGLDVVAETREFTVTVNESAGNYVSLDLARIQGDPMVWPAITCITPDGARVGLTPWPPPAANDTNSQQYRFDTPVAAFTRLRFELTFPGLPVSRYANARARVWVMRNTQLLDPPAPPTRAPFIYRTPEVAFPNPAIPTLSYQRVFPIGPWTSDPGSNPLSHVFAALLPGGTGAVSFEILYGYELAPGPADRHISTYLPVALLPNSPYTPDTIGQVITCVSAWQAQWNPTQTGGQWVFDLTYYSPLEQARPLLRLANISSTIA